MHCENEDLSQPVTGVGLKNRPNKGGGRRYYWYPDKEAVAMGYEAEGVRISADDAQPAGRAFIRAEVNRLAADVIRWKDEQDTGPKFDGTLGALLSRYQTDESSPYHALKWNTKATYDSDITRLNAAAGKRMLSAIGFEDISRWYAAAKKPKAEGEPERIRGARGLMTTLRIVLKYGAMAEIPHAARLKAIMSEMRFKAPKARTKTITFAQAVLVTERARENGALSIALGQALQFDGMLRQSSVCGQWRPMAPGEDAGGRAVMNGKVWEDGVCWNDIGDDMVLRFETSKRDHRVEIDLKLYPMILAEIERVPPEQRIGPMVIDERSGLPYSNKEYGKRWRKMAKLAGVPDDVWNRDSRSGGVTEAGNAGADIRDTAKHAAHSDPNFTAKVYDRGTLEAARRVANARTTLRNAG